MKTMVILTAALVGISSQISLEPTSKVWVKGDSTVRAFTCNATQINSVLNTSGSSDIASLLTDAQVTIPVARLDCGNGKMNDHMRKALKAEQHPDIAFTLTSYQIDGTSAVLLGKLTMAGTTRDVEIAGSAVQEGELVRVQAEKQLAMTEWGVKPPSLMLGTMKVKDKVTVGFDVALKP